MDPIATCGARTRRRRRKPRRWRAKWTRTPDLFAADRPDSSSTVHALHHAIDTREASAAANQHAVHERRELPDGAGIAERYGGIGVEADGLAVLSGAAQLGGAE